MEGAPQKELSLFDSTCIIVGIIIGAGIYETAPLVAKCLGSGMGVMLIWLAGGVLALIGALCYAELATTYPREGGDYIYLTRAYGRWPGYMFGWAQLAVVRPGDIALMAFIFARYAQTLYAPFTDSGLSYAAAVIVVLTVINILGVKAGKWTQNFLTVAKFLGLVAISVVGFTAPSPPQTGTLPAVESFTWEGLQLAFILVLFTFGGWNEMAYVAAEIKRPQQNIVRALVTGTVAVTALYVLVNGAFLSALGLAGMSNSQAVAVEDWIFVSGEKGVDPSTGKIAEGGIAAETRQALTNIKMILKAAGASMDDVVRCVVYMADTDDFSQMNEVYASFFPKIAPARSTVIVAELPLGLQILVEATALRGSGK